MPLGRSIKLNLTSEDVVHGFFLPSYRIKVDARCQGCRPMPGLRRISRVGCVSRTASLFPVRWGYDEDASIDHSGARTITLTGVNLIIINLETTPIP